MTLRSDTPANLAEVQSALASAVVNGHVDLDRLRAVVDSIVPFNTLVGVRITELDAGTAVAEIPAAEKYLNHLGTVHAGALFLLAEVACAGAFAGAIAPRLADLRVFVLRESRTTFAKPAQGRIRAHGTIDAAVSREIVGRDDEARFELTGSATLRDNADTPLATVEFDYVCRMAATRR